MAMPSITRIAALSAFSPFLCSARRQVDEQKVLATQHGAGDEPGMWDCAEIHTCEECLGVVQPDEQACHWDASVGCLADDNFTEGQGTSCFTTSADARPLAAEMLWKIAYFEEIDAAFADEAITIFQAVRALLFEEMKSNPHQYLLTEVDPNDTAEVFMFGDIHGSQYSIVPILRGILYGLGKDEPCKDGHAEGHAGACLLMECNDDVHYVFLGDYVDRGDKMLEVALMVMSLKLLCPKHVTLLRGNHETAPINGKYGLLETLRTRIDGTDPYDDWALQPDQDDLPQAIGEVYQEDKMTGSGAGLHLWYAANMAFQALPISARVKGKVWCMHGGPPEGGMSTLISPAPLPELALECEDDYKPICQMMWNDVVDDDNLGWTHNAVRTIAKAFGRPALEHLLKEDNLDMIVRGHDYLDGVHEKGYSCLFENAICTIFTASEYTSAEKRGTVFGESEFDNNNPGAVLWLHGKNSPTFRKREGVSVATQFKRGELSVSVLTFDGTILRHVAQGLGCDDCLQHVLKQHRRHIESYPEDRVARMTSNHWVSKSPDNSQDKPAFGAVATAETKIDAAHQLHRDPETGEEFGFPTETESATEATQKLDKLKADTKKEQEDVLSQSFIKDGEGKTTAVEDAIEKTNDAELPYIKGIKVLALQESVDTIAACEAAATAAQESIRAARNWIAAKTIEAKQFASPKPIQESFAKLTERINSAAKKLSEFKRDTEGRKEKQSQFRKTVRQVPPVASRGDK